MWVLRLDYEHVIDVHRTCFQRVCYVKNFKSWPVTSDQFATSVPRVHAGWELWSIKICTSIPVVASDNTFSKPLSDSKSVQ
jgi:hypothetical protein